MNLIGRKKEINQLDQCTSSGRPEFMIVYGRRRVGKTYLIKEYFNNTFSFYATGLLGGKTREQLKSFNESLTTYSGTNGDVPKDWLEAFRMLRELLETDAVKRDAYSNRRVVFLDEVPWMDTARSDFKMALDHFWNSYASSQEDILLIVCGSATSWIINNILYDKGGFYNRITRQLALLPFTLSECEEYFKSNGFAMTRKQVMESYMVFGGVPYYLNLFDNRLNTAQNIDSLIFAPHGQLRYEYEHLFSSLYKNPRNHLKIIQALAAKKDGMQRTEMVKKAKISDGEGLTKALRELEECGFIRKYKNYTKKKNSVFYQLVDPFILFSRHFLEDESIDSWMKFYRTPSFFAWRGNAFEIVCLNHLEKVKAALGITGVSTMEYAWKSERKKDGAQIDLLIDRRDDVINICEMKYSDEAFAIDAKYEQSLIHKAEVFRMETNPDKAIHITLITASGLKENEYSSIAQNVIAADDLF